MRYKRILRANINQPLQASMDMLIELHGLTEMEKDYQFMIQTAKRKDN